MTCDTLGLFSRSVEDLELLASVFKFADDELVPSVPFSLKGARVAFCKSPVWSLTGPGTRKAFEKAQELLKKSAATVAEIELPQDFTNILEWHGKVLAGEGRTSFLGGRFPFLLWSAEVLMRILRLPHWEGENEQEHRWARGEHHENE